MNVRPETLSFDLNLSADDIDNIVGDMSIRELFGHVHSPGHEHRIGHYQFVSSGIFFPCDPRPEEVHLEDIATGASRLFRFNGQTIRGMTVAEHEWHCSYVVPREQALEALMHDSAEPYISDQIRPLKVLPIYGTIYKKIEAGIELAIAERFKLNYPWSREVRHADELLAHAEVAHNIASKDDGVHYDRAIYDRKVERPADIGLNYWTPELARIMWLDRFKELAQERGLSLD